jgi:chromosome segregation ATPase
LSGPEDRLQELEDGLLKALELFRQARTEKLALKRESEKLRLELKERAKAVDARERELVALRKDREEARTRIEKLLRRIDALTTRESGG